MFCPIGDRSKKRWVKPMGRHRRATQIASSAFIIMIGILLFTNAMTLMTIWAFKNGLYVERFAVFAVSPTYIHCLPFYL
jgi:hypothetical protein